MPEGRSPSSPVFKRNENFFIRPEIVSQQFFLGNPVFPEFFKSSQKVIFCGMI
jgi:hypothetical protein